MSQDRYGKVPAFIASADSRETADPPDPQGCDRNEDGMTERLWRDTTDALHTLFFADAAALRRCKNVEKSLTTDAERRAFRALGVGLISFEPSSKTLVQARRFAEAQGWIMP